MNLVILSGQYYPREPKENRHEFAIRESYKSKGEWDSMFHSCCAFGQTAEFIQEYFTEGEVITIQGRLSSKVKETSEGNRTFVNVTVDRAVFPAKPKKGLEPKAEESSSQTDAFDPFSGTSGRLRDRVKDYGAD